jgi:hypothetical protein
MDVFTLHALSGGGNDAPGLIQNIDALVNGIPLQLQWCAAGDFNREPSTWAPAAGAIMPPNNITRPANGVKIDYCVQFPAPQQVGAGFVISTFVVSDHYPVICDI